MTDSDKAAVQAARTAAAKVAREVRLSKALRENLRRRKGPASAPNPDRDA